MPAKADPAEQQRLEAIVGNPAEKMHELKQRIQASVIKTFREVQTDFLDVMWTMDRYRVEEVIPRSPRPANIDRETDIGDGLYRSKGNFFSDVMTLILDNKTTSQLASRRDVQGFSQKHQIDIAWPGRGSGVLVDPLICCEAKLSGAPGAGKGKARGGLADWSNRRKELKFQATDLKLYRQATDTRILNWDQWRRKASPLVFTLWAARLEKASELTKMVSEAQILTSTYSDGVGIFGFTPSADNSRYVPATDAKTTPERVTSLDNILSLIAAEIQEVLAANNDQVPAPKIQTKIVASDLPDEE